VLRSASFFQSVVETVRDPLLVLDAELRVRMANRSFYRLFHAVPEECEGRQLYALGNGQWRIPRLMALLEEVVPSGAAVDDFEVSHDFEGAGPRTMIVNARRIDPTEHEAGLVLLSIEDVTERRRLEAERALLSAELERYNAELRRSNAELERFAYVASHDLQEPLRMVTSYTQLLARRYEGQLDEKAQRFIHHAVDGATRMQALINDLLAYSRLGTRGGEPVPVDTGQVLERALHNLQVALRAEGGSVTHGPLPVVRGDPTHLLQLFQNLLSNAVKFRGDEAPRVHVSASRAGGWWTFSVRDNGVGIDPAYFERVFVIFQRLHTRAEHPGTGIGLAICKRVVERAGGRIWVQSEPGRESTFFFTLPADDD
jgi:signal transduction histidine kinase